jgi:hypothetical protein
MKSERRHELQTNTLADWMGHQATAVKPHVNLILTAVLAVVAVVLAWVYFREWNASRSTAAWSDFHAAADSGDAAALVEMAQRHAGEPASLWATLLASDIQLDTGATQAFSDRRQAETSLKAAVAGFEAVLNDDAHGRDPLLRRRAMFGLAKAHETLFAVTADKTHLESAREFYGKTAQAWPDTVQGQSAKRKEAELSSRPTEEFLVWFSKQEPVSQEMPPTGETPTGPESPFDLSTLPGAGELLLPDEEPALPATPDAGPPPVDVDNGETGEPADDPNEPPADDPQPETSDPAAPPQEQP